MMETQPADVRQRAVALIQEAGTLLGMIPQLLDRGDELQASLDTLSKDNEDLRRDVAALKTDVQQLRTDREEMADSLTVIMNDILRLTTEAVAKLRPPERRSSFWRDGYPPASPPASESPQARPVTSAGAAWRKDG